MTVLILSGFMMFLLSAYFFSKSTFLKNFSVIQPGGIKPVSLITAGYH